MNRGDPRFASNPQSRVAPKDGWHAHEHHHLPSRKQTSCRISHLICRFAIHGVHGRRLPGSVWELECYRIGQPFGFGYHIRGSSSALERGR